MHYDRYGVLHSSRAASVRLTAKMIIALPLGAIVGPISLHAQSTWSVASQPSADIGAGTDPSEELSQVGRVFRLGNGTIVVPNEATNQIRIFDRNGRSLRAVGRTGSGPGEFRAMRWVSRARGDTILVWDWKQRRLSSISPSGIFISATPIAPPSARIPIASPVGVFSDGSLLGVRMTGESAFPFKGNEGDVGADSAVLVRYTRSGDVKWVSAPMVRREVFGMPIVVGKERFLAPKDRPFASHATWAMLGDTVVVADGVDWRFKLLDPNGRPLRQLSDNYSRRPLTRSMIDAFVNASRRVAQRAENKTDADLEREFLAAVDRGKVPFPSFLPPNSELLVDPTGLLWVQEPDTTGRAEWGIMQHAGSRNWNVRGADGRIIAKVVMPEGLRVDDIGRDYVAGVWRDADYVEHVRVYTLTRNTR